MVESKELILDVAKNVKEIGANFLRGGAFKPLTFPYRNNKYTETREKGIKWLSEAKINTTFRLSLKSWRKNLYP